MTFRIWNVKLGKQVFQFSPEYIIGNGIDINEDDTLIATNSVIGKLKIWSFLNHKLLCS